MKHPVLSFLSVLLVALSGTVSRLQAQATIDESEATLTLTVNPNGTGDYTTIAGALGYLSANPTVPAKVLIAAGTYREGGIVLNDRSAVTIIEGAAPGQVIINGADIWTNWTDEGGGNYSKPWTYNWGLATYDSNYDIQSDLGKRCEILLYDGQRLTQVADAASLVDGSFAVDEANDKLWVRPPAGGSITSDTVEVAVRNGALFFYNDDNFVLRNLTITNFASGNQHSGPSAYTVAFFGVSTTDINTNFVVDNCEIVGNNSSGLTISNTQHITLKDSSFSGNGISGMGPSRVRHVVVDNCDFNNNNWRLGGYGGFTGWGPAGTKFLNFGDITFTNCRFLNNLATGLWLDTGGEDIFVDNCEMSGNANSGMYIEASTGPYLVSNCTVIGNGITSSAGINAGGIYIAESKEVIITHCTIEDNHHYQVGIRTRDRNSTGNYSGTSFDGHVHNVTIKHSRLKGKRIAAPNRPSWYSETVHYDGGLIMMSTDSGTSYYQNEFMTTLVADHNSYYHQDRENVFSNGGNYGFTRLNLADWQNATGQDLNSVWESADSDSTQAVIEPEAAASISAPFTVVTDATASGGGYINVATATAQTTNPTVANLTTTFSVTEETNYAVVFKLQAANSGDDSVWLRINGSQWINFNGMASSPDWTWDYLRDAGNGYVRVFFLLNPGIHTLELAYREDGLNIDQIVVTSNPAYTDAPGSVVDARTITPNLSRGLASNVSTKAWTYAEFGMDYTSPVVVGTIALPSQSGTPVALRVRNVTSQGCQLRLEALDGSSAEITRDVHLIAAEEGVYTAAANGVTMEVARVNSTVTDHNGSWAGQAYSYANSYSSPVVLGQVMTSNGAKWSAFWACGSTRTSTVTSSALRLGKHVAEDPDTTRADETLGVIILESGSGTVNGIPYAAGISNDNIKGVGDSSSGYTVNFSGVTSPDIVSLSMAKMDGINGGLPVLYGSNPIGSSSLKVAIDECQLNDSERKHTTEPVSYLVLGQ